MLAQKLTCKCSVDEFSTARTKFGLTINIKEHWSSIHTSPGKKVCSPQRHSQQLETQWSQQIHLFQQHLVSEHYYPQRDEWIISRASATCGRLYISVCKKRGFSLQTKQKMYRALVVLTVLYACKAWAMYQHHAKRLNSFNTMCPRKFLNMKW